MTESQPYQPLWERDIERKEADYTSFHYYLLSFALYENNHCYLFPYILLHFLGKAWTPCFTDFGLGHMTCFGWWNMRECYLSLAHSETFRGITNFHQSSCSSPGPKHRCGTHRSCSSLPGLYMSEHIDRPATWLQSIRSWNITWAKNKPLLLWATKSLEVLLLQKSGLVLRGTYKLLRKSSPWG